MAGGALELGCLSADLWLPTDPGRVTLYQPTAQELHPAASGRAAGAASLGWPSVPACAAPAPGWGTEAVTETTGLGL